MTKAEVVNIIAKRTGIEKAQVLCVLEEFMDVVKETVSPDESVYLRGFGSFIAKKRAQKAARDIKKEVTVIIPEHYVPAFKPSKDFTVENK